MMKNLEISELIEKNIISKLGSKLKLFIVIGSMNYSDFFSTWSDLDILIVVDSLNQKTMKIIRQIRDSFSSHYKRKIDIKPFTLADFCNGNNFFINSWFYKALEGKKEKILYFSNEVSIPKVKDTKDMILPITYCIYKLRKVFLRAEFDKRGKVGKLNREEEMKNIISTIFSMIKFALAFYGIYAFSPSEIIKESKKTFGKNTAKLLTDLYKMKMTSANDIKWEVHKENVLLTCENIYECLIEDFMKRGW